MKKEHLTPDGWKPCSADKKTCRYEHRAASPANISQFFTYLFGSKTPEPAPAPVKATTPVPAEPAKDPLLNKVVVNDDGRFQVLSQSYGQKTPLVHLFGDLVADRGTVDALQDADVDREYQMGECGVLAGELWNTNEHVEDYYVYRTDNEPVFGLHQFVKLKDGTYADSMGVWSHEALMSYWGAVEPGEIAVFDDGEPVPDKKPNLTISNPVLFAAVNDAISAHMSKHS